MQNVSVGILRDCKLRKCGKLLDNNNDNNKSSKIINDVMKKYEISYGGCKI